MNTELFLASHINHPFRSMGARDRGANTFGSTILLTCLCKEYTFRYGKTHAVVSRCWQELRNPPANLKGKKGFR
jgi:hypothetical protein